MIKGPLGLQVWADTLSDPTAIKPTDLITLDQKNEEANIAHAVLEEQPVLVLAA